MKNMKNMKIHITIILLFFVSEYFLELVVFLDHLLGEDQFSQYSTHIVI